MDTTLKPAHRLDDDKHLISKIACGDHIALSQLVKKYQTFIINLAKSYVSAATAEEIAQDTFMAIYTNAKHYDESKSFRTWMITIATRKAFDAIRREKKHKNNKIVTDDEFYHPPHYDFDKPAAADESNLLNSMLNKLDRPSRDIIVLCYYEGLDYNNMAEHLNIPVGTVKSRLSKAKERLKSLLSNHSCFVV